MSKMTACHNLLTWLLRSVWCQTWIFSHVWGRGEKWLRWSQVTALLEERKAVFPFCEVQNKAQKFTVVLLVLRFEAVCPPVLRGVGHLCLGAGRKLGSLQDI